MNSSISPWPLKASPPSPSRSAPQKSVLSTFHLIKSEPTDDAVTQDQPDHVQADLHRLPEVPRNLRFAEPAPVMTGPLDHPRAEELRDDDGLRQRVGTADGKPRPDQRGGTTAEKTHRAPAVGDRRRVEQKNRELRDDPVAVPEEQPHVGAVPDELRRGPRTQHHVEVVRVYKQFEDVPARERAVRLGEHDVIAPPLRQPPPHPPTR